MEGMSESEYRIFLLDISEYLSISTSEVIGAGTVASVIGTQIPVGHRRYIWSLQASSNNGAEQNVQITVGDAVSGYENVRQTLKRVPDTTTANILKLGKLDPIAAFKRINPVAVADTNDRVVALHQTSQIDIDLAWYDLPLEVRNVA